MALAGSQSRSPAGLTEKVRVPLGVPAYFGPWERDRWGGLLADVPSVVVLNPDNGPGRIPSPDYRALCELLRKRGTRTLMYVHTGYLSRDVADIAVDAERALSWFGVDGVFFDEVPVDNTRPTLSKLDRLADLSSAACTFNSGRVVPERWYSRFATATFVTFEGTPQQFDGRFPVGARPTVAGPPDRQWWLLHSAPLRTHRSYWNLFHELGLGHAYVTNDRLPNPWDAYVSPRYR